MYNILLLFITTTVMADPRVEPAYRHRSSLPNADSHPPRDLHFIDSRTNLFTKALERAEGRTEVKQALKKVLITKSKPKVQGISIHVIPPEFPLPEKEIKVVSSTSNHNISDPFLLFSSTPWPPVRSTVGPLGTGRKHPYTLLSGWMSSDEEKSEKPKARAAKVQRDLSRKKSRKERKKKMADVPSELDLDIEHTRKMLNTNSASVSMAAEIARLHIPRRRQLLGRGMGWSGKREIKHSPISKISTTTEETTSTTNKGTTPDYVERLASSIEEEERQLVKNRQLHKKANYGVNPLMYKVVDGVLYDRAGQVIKRLNGVQAVSGDELATTRLEKYSSKFRLVEPPQVINVDQAVEEGETDELPSFSHDEEPKLYPQFFSVEGKTPTIPVAPPTVLMDIITPSPPITDSFGRQPHPILPLPHKPTKAFVDQLDLFGGLPFPKQAHIAYPQSSPSSLMVVEGTSTKRKEKFYDAQPISAPPFPFVNCYMNDDGFMCCNKTLESLMRTTYDLLPCRLDVNGCPVQEVVQKLKEEAESTFTTDFEVVAAEGDFAAQSHFSGDLTCKIEKEGRFISAYATASSLTILNQIEDNNPLKIVTDFLMKPKESSARKNRDSSDNFVDLPDSNSDEALVILNAPKEEELLDIGSFQFDGPSITVDKADVDSNRVLPYHERTRGKSALAFTWI